VFGLGSILRVAGVISAVNGMHLDALISYKESSKTEGVYQKISANPAGIGNHKTKPGLRNIKTSWLIPKAASIEPVWIGFWRHRRHTH